ncbi:hypothetical protein [Neorhodopirellula pilleata]|uniref:Uncharacterized protein n=1 Tax=Neorhodopirellula pilleata TaxID=2714738 RepID=A0A5C6AVL9_9BACT|nr:hypothetical protein [Neorhodopirellula pilleata]TWU03638.1 hypothetical protein Pla100_05670 [Neorhodopirellula pilleata]
MNTLCKLVSLVALGLVTLPSVLYFAGSLSHDMVLTMGLIGTVVWFLTTPWWMGREVGIDADQVEI